MLARISRERTIYLDEYTELVRKMCDKWSFNPRHTFKALEAPRGVLNFRLVRGEMLFYDLRLERVLAECEAQSNGWQFSDIEEGRERFKADLRRKEYQLYGMESDVLYTLKVVKQIDEEIKHGEQHTDMR